MTPPKMLYARRDATYLPCDGATLTFRPLGGSFGASVEGIDLSVPATEAQVAELHRALEVYGLLCFPKQDLAPADEVRTMHYFNDVSNPEDVNGGVDNRRIEGFPSIVVLSNIVREDGTPIGSTNRKGMEWHTDGSGWQLPPLASTIYAIEVPENGGGETYFANGYLAFEALSPEERELLDGMVAHYSYITLHKWLSESIGQTPYLSEEQMARFPDVDRPLVRTHPVTGRKALWFSIEEIVDIDGMGNKSARDLLLGLIQTMTTTPHVVYRHDWQPGDLVLWDNRCLMHSVSEYNYEGYRRLMHQITGKDLHFAI
jgi:taurine dioxygenase